MKKFIAYSFGFLGFLLQGWAVVGIPICVFFLDWSSWWLFAIFPLGFAGMVPMSIMTSMLKEE